MLNEIGAFHTDQPDVCQRRAHGFAAGVPDPADQALGAKVIAVGMQLSHGDQE